MNTSGLSTVSALRPETDNENNISGDETNYDFEPGVMYDSDKDREYIPTIDGEDTNDSDERHSRRWQRIWSSTPHKWRLLPSLVPADPEDPDSDAPPIPVVRNVTTDNWLTSVLLVSDMYENCGMTPVGTMKTYKKEVPAKMREKDTRVLGSSAFLFTKELTLVSFVPATSKKKIVLMLSLMHTTPTLGKSGKPEMIEFYNSTKGGVDAYD
ncbi:hypothetical protein Pcinc_012836 [Petrolisthes cinctipes]|uniref:PiggyBac transposable element-derived protein domain-containing protein n=1 Tax=Petrolisthes cinctipes TaxID=88211 RepID=A0AAE1FZS3_PETCI|nr:hypothetical protein Pcinc_012836 [Petrolisthes cinctipes]